MAPLSRIRTLFARIARYAGSQRRLSEFTCSDCERNARCGLPPSANCVHRAEAIARDEWRGRRHGTPPQLW